MTTRLPDSTDLKRPSLWAGVTRAARGVYEIPGIRRGLRVIGITIGRLSQDDGWAMASHLTLSALMALFPFLIVVAAVAGIFGDQSLADQAADLLLQAWPQDVARPIARELENVLTGPRAGVLTISVVVTLYLASNGVEAVRAALQRAYGTEQQRGFLFLKLQSFGFVLLGALACLALALLGVLGPLIWTLLQRWWPAIADQSANFQVFRYLIVGSLLAAALTAAHLWLPGRRWQGIRIWPGIVATMVLWWLATSAFAAYLAGFANYVSTYAGLAGIVTALFYLYIMSLIVIFGAEFNAAIARTSPRATRNRADKKKKRRPIVPPRPSALED
jgi:membrane protein